MNEDDAVVSSFYSGVGRKCGSLAPSDVAALNAESTNAALARVSRCLIFESWNAMTKGDFNTMSRPSLSVTFPLRRGSLELTRSPAINTANT